MEELTLKDIKKAIDLIKEPHKEEEIYEDDFQKIYGYFGEPTKIQLKEKGVKLLDNMIKGSKQGIAKDKKMGRVTTLYGVPVVVDEE